MEFRLRIPILKVFYISFGIGYEIISEYPLVSDNFCVLFVFFFLEVNDDFVKLNDCVELIYININNGKGLFLRLKT